MLVNVTSRRVDVIVRNVVVASVPRARVAAPECRQIEITSSTEGTFATFVGLSKPDGSPQRTGFADPNLRPAIVGVFTDMTGPAPPGLSFSATIDTRFSTTPTPLKLAAILLAITATVVALLALWRLDRLDGRRMRRIIPARWRTFTPVDIVVVGGFLLWHVIGANSSDDGYILGMARVADHAGYMSNYFRWFGSPEDPFGWYYNLLALMTHVSDASIWIRLPDLVCALVCWLLLSREVLPRLGPAVSSSRAAMWAAGLVLLAAWMPFNNGLRPEGQIATGALITYVLIERAISLRSAHPGGAGHHHRGVHARHPAHRIDRGRGPGRRRPTHPAHPGATTSSWSVPGRWCCRCWPPVWSYSPWCSPTRRWQRCWKPPGFAPRSVRARSGTPRICATTT